MACAVFYPSSPLTVADFVAVRIVGGVGTVDRRSCSLQACCGRESKMACWVFSDPAISAWA